MTVKEEVNVEIKDMIYTIREQQVMLDFDISSLLGYELKQLNRQIKRHASDFNEEIIFQLTKEELELVQCQNGTTPTNLMAGNTGGRRTLPYALTMQAIEVLGTFLRKNDVQKTMKELLQAFQNESSNSMLVTSKNTDDIKNLIYTVRGEQVMLDVDLANIYGYEVKNLNRQVKNNIEKFPSDMMFQLTLEEANSLPRCKNCTLEGKGKNIKYAPFVFTEQGIYMLATVLKGELATKQTLLIIRTFKQMRHYFAENRQLVDINSVTNLAFEVGKLNEQSKEQRESLTKLESKVGNLDANFIKYEDRLNEVDSHLLEVNIQMKELMDSFIDDSQRKQWVFVDGQKFEADEAYIHIYKQAKKSIFVIDDYISIKTLSHLKHKNSDVQVILFSDNKAKGEKVTSIEIDDFNSQYAYLCLYPTHKLAHDRLIVLDYGTSDEVIYMCGASSKDAGNRFCTILKVYDPLGFRGIIDKLFNT